MSPDQKQRALRISVVDGAFHAVMLGASESYLGALAVELGHGPAALAILATLPMVCGAVAQLLSAPLASLVGGRKRLVVLGAALQALTHLGLLLLAVFEVRGLLPLLAIKIGFWISGMVIAPAWSAWMATLAAGKGRERYFAGRAALIQLALLASFLGSGVFIAQAASAEGSGLEKLDRFAVLFVVGMLARFLSAAALYAQPDEGGRPTPPGLAGHRIADAVRGADWRVAVYVAALMAAVQVSAPLFTPYMLRELRVDYTAFATLTSTTIVVKALAFALCHPLSRRFGLRITLWIGALLLGISPAMWALSSDLWVLYLANACAGCAWAAYEFASLQLLMDSAPDKTRLEFLAVAGTLSSLLQLVGALFGAELVTAFDFTLQEVFLVSAALRLLAVPLLFLSRRRTARLLHIAVRLVSVRPAGGTITAAVPLEVPDDAGPAAAGGRTSVGVSAQ